MANTYTQIYIQIVFAVKGRQNLIVEKHRDKSQIDMVAKYILNQPKHHKKTTFKDEYINFLKKFEIEYDEKYLFKWND